ncbi:MAG: ThuA domain-containing protein [Clostridiales bacterium]|jgi:type 1 glutamine amidotransferase|nr:ThuA domain-containing protein [Clostridiales bacterium]
MSKTVFVVWDDMYHPEKTYAGITRKLFGGPEWELQTSYIAEDIIKLEKAPDLMVNFTIGRPDGVKEFGYTQQGILKKMVEDGMGIMYVHAGLACIQEYTPAYEISLGHFASHPQPHYPTRVCPLPGSEHPILTGITPFEEPDEHYFCKVDIEKAVPFLCSISVAGTEIAGWTQELGKGRVCCLTPGHTEEMLAKMEKLLENSAKWCVHEL